jgi:Phage major capsid protein E
MTTTRSYTNAFEIVDYTEELQLIPNSWTLLNDSGVFAEEFLTTHTVTFEEQAQTLGLIGDQFRGAKPQANKDDNRKIRSYPVAHFPIVDAVKPEDIQGKRAYGATDMAETEAAVIARKMQRIRRNMDITLEVGRFSTLTTGNLYAPNGTVSGNLFSDFGITQTTVDFVLGTSTTDVVAKVETVIASLQDTANTGDVITGVIAYCSPEFFAKLIGHAKIQDAYKYFSATEGQQINRNRAGGNNGLYREFSYAGIRFVEVRTVLAGQRLIPAGDVVFIPTGTTDTFVSYFSPANRMDFVNTVAERGYLWTYRSPKGDGIDIDGEMNAIHICRRPQLIIRGYSSN